MYIIAIISEDFVSTDLTYCQRISKETGIPLTIYNSTTSEILEAVENTIKILKNFNDIEIRNNVVMYLAIKWAKDNNKKSVITGDGADELFAGYNFLVNKWYFDELYDIIFIQSSKKIGLFFWKTIDIKIIDKFGPDGLSLLIKNLSLRASKFQSGFIYQYAFMILIGLSALLTFLILN